MDQVKRIERFMLCVAALLLVASSAKFASIAAGVAEPSWKTMVAIGEIVTALAIIAWPASTGIRVFTLTTFVVFLFWASRAALLQRLDCGCFGELKVSPIAVAVLDATVVMCLCYSLRLDFPSRRSFISACTLAVPCMAVSIAALSGLSTSWQSKTVAITSVFGDSDPGIDFRLTQFLKKCRKKNDHPLVLPPNGEVVVFLSNPGCKQCRLRSNSLQSEIAGTTATLVCVQIGGRRFTRSALECVSYYLNIEISAVPMTIHFEHGRFERLDLLTSKN